MPVRLTILRRIASGGMGKVYQAVQHGAEGFLKTVAIKMIRERFARDDEFVRMFIGEAKLVADLVHQNIAQVYHLGRNGDLLYIVMEYVEGVNVTDFLRCHRDTGRRVPVELAAFIASRVCRGLEYAHNKTDLDGTPLGIVHRDVSSKNVMLTSLGEVKILDFGVAKARNLTIEREGARVFGKYGYMSPEQARQERTDNRSDLYSLGVVLWEMLAGRHPFEGEEPGKRLRERVRRGEIPPLGEFVDLPPMLGQIVERALRRDPGERYADAGRMGYDLEYYMYHKGYGPTIVTLEKYLGKLFADHAAFRAARHAEPAERMPDTIILDSSEATDDRGSA